MKIYSLFLFIAAYFLFLPAWAIAQVTSDGILNTVVNSTDDRNFTIEDGDRAGNNLFHSFEDFSVPNNGSATFDNPAEIERIISRVTGGNISTIEGLIQANGSADLLLVNPAGMIFGENASLNLGGSFLGSTASSILFEEGEFSATNLTQPPLLTINVPIGLGFGNNPGDIINRSNFGLTRTAIDEEINPAFAGTEFTILNSDGLQVQPGKNIALVGGNVILEDAGAITAPGGRVELGGLVEAGEITIDDRGSLVFPPGIARGDVSLTEQARVKVAAGGGGAIAINAANLTILEQSELYGGIAEDLGSAEARAGDITIDATESVKIVGSGGVGAEPSNPENSFALIFNDYDTAIRNVVGFRPNQEDLGLPNLGRNPKPTSTARGNAGAIAIETKRLEISDRGSLTAKVYGRGNTGNIDLNAEQIVIARGDLLNQVISGTGNTGDINITTDNLRITGSAIDVDGDASFVLTDTRSRGDSGNINITAANKIEIDKVSLLQTQTLAEGRGDAGDINITTNEFDAEGGVIQADNIGSGKTGNISIEVAGDINFDTITLNTRLANTGAEGGGNITVEAANLSIIEDSSVQRISQILSDTQGQGDAGDIFFIADNKIEIEDTIIKAQADENTTGNGGNIAIASDSFILSDDSELSTQTLGQGNAGNLNISSPEFRVTSGASINLNATGTGEAGSLRIDARDITLDLGSLTAETRVGDRGNITLSNADTLLLRNNSQITTNAFESATGGDITIAADGIIALDNSDITANAFEGQGGEIQITTQGIFSDLNSQITAASELGIDGTVTFNTPDVDPTAGIFELPEVSVDAENVLAQDLCRLEGDRIAKGSSFVITGKGGLVPTSAGSLDNRDRLVDWASREDVEVSDSGAVGIRQREKKQAEQDYPQVRQAKGLLVGEDGGTWLTANAPGAAVSNSSMKHPDCSSK